MSSSTLGVLSRLGAGAVLMAMFVAASLMGSSLGVFLDLPSALLVFGGGGLAWALTSGSALRQLPATLQAAAPSPAQLELAELTVGQGRRATWLVGVSGLLIGLIQMLQAIDDPSAVGPALAVALLTVFYPIFAEIFIFQPLRSAVAFKAAESLQQSEGTHALERDLAASLDALNKLDPRQKTVR